MESIGQNINSKRIDIFQFENYRDFLMAAGFPQGNYNSRSNTLQKWANRLGYRSPSSLNMVLKGSRLPSREMQRALIKDLGLNRSEAEYFELLVEKEKCLKKAKSPELILKRLNELSGGNNCYQMPLQEFRYISKWYFMVLKQLVNSPDFIDDLDWIHRKLKKKVSKKNIREALEVLEELGLVKRDSSGKRVGSKTPIKIENSIKNTALQSHHGGMIEQGFNALTQLPPERRQICAMTFRMSEERISEAQNFLFKFLEEFDRKFFDEQGEDVFQLNLQLFPHTDKVREI